MNYAVISRTTQQENKDRLFVAKGDENYVIVIADGAGGIGGGAEAAQLSINLLQNINAHSPIDALQQIDRKLYEDHAAGETTVIYLKIERNKVSGASIGDSEAWLINNDTVLNITKNQKRKPLAGSGKATATGFDDIPFKGTLLVATDGLTKYLSMSTIASTVQESPSLSNCCEILIEKSRYKSGELPDDISIVLCTP